jgi:hypothetical protein
MWSRREDDAIIGDAAAGLLYPGSGRQIDFKMGWSNWTELTLQAVQGVEMTLGRDGTLTWDDVATGL